MLKNSKIQILLILSLGIVLFLAGCVDTSVNPIPSSLNYRSQVKVVNFATGVASATIKLQDKSGSVTSFGAVAYGAENGGGFKDIPAGNKTLLFNNGESYKLSADTDIKMRVFILGSSSDRRVAKLTERYIFQTKDSPNSENLYPSDSAAVNFMNGSSDASIDGFIATAQGGDTTVTFSAALESGHAVSNVKLKAGSYDFYVLSAGDTLATFKTVLGARSRYTAAVYGSSTTLKGKVFKDD